MKNQERTILEVVKEGEKVVYNEWIQFLKMRKTAEKRYKEIMKTTKMIASWTDIKIRLELKERKKNIIFLIQY